jgi:ABC-type methionine transport system permease subunit
MLISILVNVARNLFILILLLLIYKVTPFVVHTAYADAARHAGAAPVWADVMQVQPSQVC